MPSFLFISVTYYRIRTRPWVKFENIYSFRFTDSAGVSELFGGDGWVHGTKHEYYSYQGCQLAYLSGRVRNSRLFTFKPYFECPPDPSLLTMLTTTMLPITVLPASLPQPTTETVTLEGALSSAGDWGLAVSDKELYLEHGPVTAIRIHFDTRVNSIQSRYLSR